MMITNHVNLDLQQPGQPAVINAVQEDRCTRQLKIKLTSGGADWPVPDTASVLVCFSRPDGAGGQYDTLPTGAAAWSAEGNVLTVLLAPQVLAVSGVVSLWITLSEGDSRLSTFAVLVNVAPRAGTDQDGGELLDVGSLILTDRQSGTRCRVYVSDSDLMMEEVN